MVNNRRQVQKKEDESRKLEEANRRQSEQRRQEEADRRQAEERRQEEANRRQSEQRRVNEEHRYSQPTPSTSSYMEGTYVQSLTQDPLVQKICSAVDIMGIDMDSVIGATQRQNAPRIVLFKGNIRKCYGCKKPIEHSKLPFPHDVVVQMSADVEIVNTNTGNRFSTKSKVHFHPTINCLQLFDASVEKRNLTIADDILLQLKVLQLESLHCKGFLKYIIKNKLATLQL